MAKQVIELTFGEIKGRGKAENNNFGGGKVQVEIDLSLFPDDKAGIIRTVLQRTYCAYSNGAIVAAQTNMENGISGSWSAALSEIVGARVQGLTVQRRLEYPLADCRSIWNMSKGDFAKVQMFCDLANKSIHVVLQRLLGDKTISNVAKGAIRTWLTNNPAPDDDDS